MVKTIKSVAGVVLRNEENKYLLVQEKQPKAHGLWNLPAGHVDKKESLIQAALRECYEETGLVVELINPEPLEIQFNKLGDRQLYSFEAQVISGTLKWPKDELLDARWLSLDEIQELNNVGKIRDQWVVNSTKKVHKKYANTRY